MKVSIIVPIYNVEKYLKRCIDSLLNQTYSNIEIILVNDGSTDTSSKICNSYKELDNRVKIINQKNKGLPGARNSGLKISKGDYISFIDSDDEIDPDMILDFTKKISSKIPDIITSNIFQYKKGNKEYKYLRNNLPYNKVLHTNEIKKYFIEPYYGGEMGIIPSVCTKMYKKTFLTENKLFFNEALKRAEDYWFNFYAFIKAKKVIAINKSYYHYYANEGSIIRTYRDNQFELYLKSRKKLLHENELLNCHVNWKQFDTHFINNINEHILLIIKNKGYYSSYTDIKKIITNEEFKNCFQNTISNKSHIKIIKFLLPLKMWYFIHTIYFTWSIKL